MLLFVGLATVIGAQAGGALALWPDKPVPVATKGLGPAAAEQINVLVRNARSMQRRLDDASDECTRLEKNEAAAIQARDTLEAERDALKIRVAELEVEADDLAALAAGHRNAALSAKVEAAASRARARAPAKKARGGEDDEDNSGGESGGGAPAHTPGPGR